MSDLSKKIITIDGASGVGKGTISKLLAHKLGWDYLDSGALYRALACRVSQTNTDVTDIDKLQTLAIDLPIDFSVAKHLTLTVKIFLDNQDVTQAIRTEECGNVASKLAKITEVRKALLKRQRDFLTPKGLVADGRDMGTVIFPKAKLKIFLTADADIRAQRRFKQLQELGVNADLVTIKKNIEERDTRDIQRKSSPLKPAKDAIVIDTSDKTINEVFANIWSLVEKGQSG
ncbi:MAG: cytidylate kinase [Thiotrichales bacterium]|nr:MAG: cytidylate kinase [Thiotrichales bacterium]